MTANYVKASSGCSAPAQKHPSAAMANLGKMKLIVPELQPDSPLLAKLLIKHPYNSGLQFDQIKRSYIPTDDVRTPRPSHHLNANLIGTRIGQRLRPISFGIGLNRRSRLSVSTAALSSVAEPELLATRMPVMMPLRSTTNDTTTVPVSPRRLAFCGYCRFLAMARCTSRR